MNLTIKKRIYWSFLLLVVLFVANAIVTTITLNNNKKLTGYISNVIDPSLEAMEIFRNLMIESKMYSTNWVWLRSKQADKDALKKLHTSAYPELRIKLNSLKSNWHHPYMADSLKSICNNFEDLIGIEKKIMSLLKTFDDYDDLMKKFEAAELVEDEILPRTAVLMNSLDHVISFERTSRKEQEKSLHHSSSLLRTFIICLAIIIVCIGLILSFYLTRKIVKPISKIRDIINDLGKGIISNADHVTSKDEIGEMIRSVNHLSEKLADAASFATKVGTRNFTASFEPLSEKDMLGKAIIAMRDNLKKSEKELYETNYQIEAFFSNIDKVFFSIDMENNKLIQMSPACKRIYGYTEIDFSVNPNLWRDIVLKEDKENMPLVTSEMKAGKSFVSEHRIRKKNGQIRWIETNITPTLNTSGQLIRMDAISSDITKRKEAEEVLRASNFELRKINAELDKFVYSVSHDLRAPLSSMLGVIEISLEETREELMTDHLGMLKASINKLDGFILDILNYSRNARLEIHKEEINFNEMIGDITSHLKHMSDLVKVDVRVDINCPAPFLSDKSRVSVILNNLISNAIRYGNPKVDDPFVNIKVDTSDTEAHILVKDNGIGISKELHEKVFEMFFRISENSVGSGLGLYIVKETIDKLNGKIEVDSEPGKGTAFSIRIPNN